MVFFAVPAISTVTPANGYVGGGTIVTITGVALGSGSDITSVTLDGLSATITSQTDSSVVVTTATGYLGTGAVVVSSTSNGDITANDAWSYVGAPVLGNALSHLTRCFIADHAITSVYPTGVSMAGGAIVTITGVAIGSGADITGVTMDGAAATVLSQTSSQVIVRAGAGVGIGSGRVYLNSASSGTTSWGTFYYYAGVCFSSFPVAVQPCVCSGHHFFCRA